jgi:predicted transcriptional regulator
MTSNKATASTAAQLREARDEIDSLRADNARLRGALQEAIALAEQWGKVTPENSYMLAPLKALAQTVRAEVSAKVAREIDAVESTPLGG